MDEAIQEVERIIRWVNHFSATKCVVFAAGDTLSDGLVFAAIFEELFGVHFEKFIKRPKTLEQRISNCEEILKTLYNLGQLYHFSIPSVLADPNTAKNLAQVLTFFII